MTRSQKLTNLYRLVVYIKYVISPSSLFLWTLSLFSVLADSVPFADEDEGEAFDFDDSGDDIPEADRLPPAPPAPLSSSSRDQCQDKMVAAHPEGNIPIPSPPTPSDIAPSSADTEVATSRSSTAGGAAAEGEWTSAVEGTDDKETDLPPPPPPVDEDTETDPGRTGLQPKRVYILLVAPGDWEYLNPV